VNLYAACAASWVACGIGYLVFAPLGMALHIVAIVLTVASWRAMRREPKRDRVAAMSYQPSAPVFPGPSAPSPARQGAPARARVPACRYCQSTKDPVNGECQTCGAPR
jgi:hypothetical protein